MNDTQKFDESSGSRIQDPTFVGTEIAINGLEVYKIKEHSWYLSHVWIKTSSGHIFPHMNRITWGMEF